MKQDILVEVHRKLIHCSSILLPTGYMYIIKDQDMMIFILTLLSLFSIFVEILRNRIPRMKRFFNLTLSNVLRGEEIQGQLTGASWLLFGSLITVIIFPLEIAVPALIYLTIGDSFAAIIGKLYPIGKVGLKSISGTFAGFITSSTIAIKFNKIIPLEIIIFGSIVAMIVELIPHKKLNDNITIPIISALSIQLSLRYI